MRNKRKHILTLILFCSLVFSIRAQQQHPYLFFTPDRIATLKEQLKSDKEVKANYAQVEQVAREALKENNPYRKLEYLALAYQVTGEKDMQIRSKNQSGRQVEKKPSKQRIC